MSSAQLGAVARQLRTLAGPPRDREPTDRELMERFAVNGEEEAFAALVGRHAGLVLGVCHRVLGHVQDAEDAFQSTFLVLARKAGSVRWHDSVANWLYGVAYRVARKVRDRLARQRRRELDAGGRLTPPGPAGGDGGESLDVIDDEIRRLPEKYRLPILLCCLGELTTEQAARHLQWSHGSLRGRLHRGRRELRRRLLRRGLAVPAALLAAALPAARAAAPAVHSSLAASVVRAALPAAQGQAAAGFVSGQAIRYAEGVVTAMMWKKLQSLAALGVALAALAAAGTLLAPGLPSVRADGERPARALPTPAPTAARTAPALAAAAVAGGEDPKDERRTFEGDIRGADPDNGQITVMLDEGQFETMYDVATGAKVTVAGTPASLAQLRPGMHFTMRMNKDESAVESIDARWPVLETELRSVDADKRTLTFEVEADDDLTFDVTVAVAPDARVSVRGFPCDLADLVPGRRVRLDLTADKKGVTAVEARPGAGEIPGIFRRVDVTSGKLVVTLEVGGGDEQRVDFLFDYPTDLKVRSEGKVASVSDLREGMPVCFRLAPDTRTVTTILARPVPPPDEDDD